MTLPNNLPRNLSTFVGRREDLAEVRQLIGEAPLVTLTGPGGVGKTRLCLQLAAEMLDTFADGAWLVELETLTTRASCRRRSRSRWGSPRVGRRRKDALLGHIRGREMLLILDTCEHLIDACARAGQRAAARHAPACASWPRAARRWASPASGSTRSARCRCPT